MPPRPCSPPGLAAGRDPVVIGADAHAKDCMREAIEPRTQPEDARRCQARAVATMRFGLDQATGRATAKHGRVEEGRGVVCTVRLPSPLIKPDVRISRIRLSDWFHVGPTT
jgi:hypothetical protein